jgi:acyl dehydratase
LDITVGQTASRELTVTPQMIESYAQITGDRNPLHFDA